MMATMDATGGPRKRLTTYGKAARKRVPEPVNIELFNAHDGGRLEENRTTKEEKRASNTLHDSISITANTSLPQVLPSGTVDMFAVPSSDEEGHSTPGKRRKITHQVKTPGLKQSSADFHKHGVLPLQPSKKPSSTKAHRSGIFDGSHGMEAQIVTRTDKSSSSTHNDYNLDIQVQKTPHRSSLATDNPSGDFPSTTHTDGVGKRARQHQTPSPIRQNPTQRRSKAEVQSVTGVSMSTRQVSPAILFPTSSTSNTPSINEDSRQTATRSVTPTVLTPRGQRMWNGLLGDESVGTPKNTRASADFGGSLRGNTPSDMPRRRLIDSLINQSQTSSLALDFLSDSEPEEEDFQEPATIKRVGDATYSDTDMGTFQLSTHASENIRKIPLPNAIGSGGQNSQTAGPKVTYSRQRSMLAEQEMTEKMAFDTPLGDAFSGERRQKRRGSIPILAPLRSLQESDEVDEGQPGNSIRTIHELRQAGAQNRFLDEVNDLLDRIGTPTQQISMRRSGLMDLTNKMLEKSFNAKFISNGVEQRLFLHLGQEEDVICGFMMVSLLILVLDTGITPVAISQLRRQGITRMFIRLLDFSQSIVTIAKDRKTNMSKVAQVVVSQQHEKLLKLGIWEDRRPEFISPRIAALRCLDMIVRQSREAGNTADLISKELTSKLFDIIKQYSSNSSVPVGSPAPDFHFALSALESHSLRATATLDEHLSVIREVLEWILQFQSDLPDLTQLLTLRLTLNVTNNDAATSGIFATAEVMRNLGCAVVSKFTLLSKFLVEDERIAVVDHIVLMLGVMMNFAEWSATARQVFVSLHGSVPDPFDDMLTIFADNFEKISEVEAQHYSSDQY